MKEDVWEKREDLYRLGIPVPQITTLRAIDDFVARPFSLDPRKLVESFPYNLSDFAKDLGWEKHPYKRFKHTLYRAVVSSSDGEPLTVDQKSLVDSAALATVYILSRADGDNAVALTDEDRVVRGQNAMDPLEDIGKVVESLKARLSDPWRYTSAIRRLETDLANTEEECEKLREKEDSLKRELVKVVNGEGYDVEDGSLNGHLRNLNWAIITGGFNSEIVPYALRALTRGVKSLQEDLDLQRKRADLLEKDLEKYEIQDQDNTARLSSEERVRVNQDDISTLSPSERERSNRQADELTDLILQGFKHRRNKSKIRSKQEISFENPLDRDPYNY